MPSRIRSAVSLSYELAEILDALHGVKTLLDVLREPVEARERIHTVAATTSMLIMTTARLRQVVSVVRGDTDPVGILERHNAIPSGFHDCPDVLLRPWSVERTVSRAQEELAMAERRRVNTKRRPRRG